MKFFSFMMYTVFVLFFFHLMQVFQGQSWIDVDYAAQHGIKCKYGFCLEEQKEEK